MARKDWIEPNVQLFRTQVANTIAVVTPTLAAYGLVTGDVTPFSSELSGLANLIADQEAKADAAKAATEARDTARDALEARYRNLNNKVQANPIVTDALKQAAGLPVRDLDRAPVGPPTLVPVVLIEETQRLLHRLRAIDPQNPKGGKPDGVAYYAVFYKLGPVPPTGVKDCVWAGNFSKNRFEIAFAEGDGNKQVWYIAVAANSKGEMGPMSESVMGTIAA